MNYDFFFFLNLRIKNILGFKSKYTMKNKIGIHLIKQKKNTK